MSLPDQDSGVMHASGQTLSVDQSLKSSVHEFGDGQTQDVIQLVLILVQKSVFEPYINFKNSNSCFIFFV